MTLESPDPSHILPDDLGHDPETLIPMTCNTSDEILYANMRSAGARNLPIITFGVPKPDIAVIVGGGPSMALHIEEIRARKLNGHVIFALNGAGHFLRERGVVPDYVVVMDSREFNVRFVEGHEPETKFLLCTQVAPSLFDAVAGRDVLTWHSNFNGQSGYREQRPTVLIGGGTSVGIRALRVLHVLGYRDFHLYGYDSSHSAGASHAYEQPENEKFDSQTQTWLVNDVPYTGSGWMIRQANDFRMIVPQLIEEDCRISVHGEGLIPAIAREFAKPREPLERGRARPSMTFFYDLACSPASYDFLGVLAAAEQERLRRGLEGLKVVVVPGPNGGFRSDTIAPIDPVQRRKMLQNIVIDGCSLLPSIESIAFCGTRDEAAAHERDAGSVYPDRYFVDYPNPTHGFLQDLTAMRAGRMDYFEAPEWARQRARGDIDPATISITLRDTHYGSLRNSRKPEWFKAARELVALGRKVVFIRDSDTMGSYVSDFRTYDPAAESVAMRLATYERCAVNLFVPNGPCFVAWCSRLARSITFRMLNDEYPGMNEPAWYAKGFPPGSQFPGNLAERHRIVWQPDDADVIVTNTLDFLNTDTAAPQEFLNAEPVVPQEFLDTEPAAAAAD